MGIRAFKITSNSVLLGYIFLTVEIVQDITHIDNVPGIFVVVKFSEKYLNLVWDITF